MDTFHPKTDTPDEASRDVDVTGIANRVRSAVEERGLTRSQVADTMGVAKATASRRLRGDREFTANEIGLLARRLDVPVEDLLFDAN